MDTWSFMLQRHTKPKSASDNIFTIYSWAPILSKTWEEKSSSTYDRWENCLNITLKLKVHYTPCREGSFSCILQFLYLLLWSSPELSGEGNHIPKTIDGDNDLVWKYVPIGQDGSPPQHAHEEPQQPCRRLQPTLQAGTSGPRTPSWLWLWTDCVFVFNDMYEKHSWDIRLFNTSYGHILSGGKV